MLEEDPVMVGAAVAEVVAKGKGVLGLGLAAGFGQWIRFWLDVVLDGLLVIRCCGEGSHGVLGEFGLRMEGVRQP